MPRTNQDHLIGVFDCAPVKLHDNVFIKLEQHSTDVVVMLCDKDGRPKLNGYIVGFSFTGVMTRFLGMSSEFFQVDDARRIMELDEEDYIYDMHEPSHPLPFREEDPWDRGEDTEFDE